MNKANKYRIEKWLRDIDDFNLTPGSGTTRVLFTKEELGSREYIKNEMKSLGLEVTEDGIGNIFATLKGNDGSLSPVWTGSHIDTVLNAGMFDGMSGIVCGMEALKLIKDSGEKNKRDISVIVYTSEEPTRFGLSCLGSRALAGEMSLEDTKDLKDEQGKSLYQVLEELGYDHNEFEKIKKKKGDVFAAVELHVEQNHNLDTNKIPVGIVKGICAPTIFNVVINGCQSHAGGTPMENRHDAFAAASELSLSLEKITRESKGRYVTATVGKVSVEPNAVNVIPGQVNMSIDIRSIETDAKNILVEELMLEKERIESERGVSIKMELENDDIPLICDEKITDLIEKVCKDQNIEYMELISGPYHDSLFVGRFTPTGMLFVPSKNGISHSKDEWTDFEDLAVGTDILAETLLQLSNL